MAQKFKYSGNCNVFIDESVKSRTSFKTDGKTPLLVEVLTPESLKSALDICIACDAPVFILGGGTNVLFSDTGFDGVVISLAKLKGIEFSASRPDQTPADLNPGDEVVLKCLCGTQVNDIVKYCTAGGFTGMESFSGLPGTIGGASYMNARCFDHEMSEVVGGAVVYDYSAEAVKKYGEVKEMEFLFSKNDWEYKKSPFTGRKTACIYVNIVVHKAPPEMQAEIARECERIMKARVEKGHFRSPCAGSFFKNNRDFGSPTGKIIDEAGLRGFQIGGAQVAPWHGNIIINAGNATGADIRQLSDYIIQKIRAEKGFTLEPEVIFAGKN